MRTTTAERLVIKLGTGSLMKEGCLCNDIFRLVAKDIRQSMERGVRCLIVSSGAIQAGKEVLGMRADKLHKKNLSAVGGRFLFNFWGDAFQREEVHIAPLLVTYANWRSRRERLNLRNAINDYLEHGIVPVVNENDAIADEEVRSFERGISDNDKLARMVAELIKASGILFLTHSGGVFEGKGEHGARQYAEIDHAAPPDLGTAGSAMGRGGISSKLLQATACFKRGMRVAIAGPVPEAIVRFAKGNHVGTVIGNENRFYS